MKRIYKLIILLILLLEARFFYLFKFPDIIDKYNTYHVKIIIFIITIVTIIFFLITRRYKYIKDKTLFSNNIILFLILVFFETILSYINYSQYGQTVMDTIWMSYYFYIILLYYILVYLDIKFNDDSYKRIITIFSLILSIIFIVQSILYNSDGLLIVKISELSLNGIESRLGRIRLTYPSTIISFSIILSAGRILNKREEKKDLYKIIDILNVILGCIYIVYVSQTRALIVYIFISIIIMFIFRNGRNIKRLLISFLLLVSVIIVILNLSITKEYINTFNDTDNSISTIARKGAIEYFIKKGSENIVFGSGFIGSNQDSELFYIARGEYGIYSTTDVGIIGYYSSFGILGLLLYISLILKLMKIIKKLIVTKRINYCIELIGMFIFLVFSSGTLIVMDKQRIILLPFILAIFNNEFYKDKEI
ncbi:O-antigen ligase family protein [Clostridium sp. HCS.1]|uniref:O-antigen ligase family protein n=1 Tax=Clostridium sp. HCS.1 TaxID=3238594 RepID=UPI003A0FD2BF